jgi:hypothetical protein
MRLLGEINGFGGHPIDLVAFAAPFETLGINVLLAGGGVTPQELEREAALEAEAHSSQLAVFYHHDFSGPIAMPPNTRLCRASLLQTQAQPHELVFPVSWVHTTALSPLEPSTKPRVAFCGALTHPSREFCLGMLEASPEIECHFKRRLLFWNGVIADPVSHREFEENLKCAEFALCPRGAGNFSIRFYEVLKAGRIPVVIVDSDTAWPLGELIDWPRLVVCATPSTLAARICEFWSTRDTVDAQRQCAETFARVLDTPKLCTLLATQFAMAMQ